MPLARLLFPQRASILQTHLSNPSAALFDALGGGLTSERAVLLLYALLHGCARFHEYCLVRD